MAFFLSQLNYNMYVNLSTRWKIYIFRENLTTLEYFGQIVQPWNISAKSDILGDFSYYN